MTSGNKPSYTNGSNTITQSLLSSYNFFFYVLAMCNNLQQFYCLINSLYLKEHKNAYHYDDYIIEQTYLNYLNSFI